ncbi:hypothetical protein BOTBODRAFT_612397 [Botryobasidium botryosum FD-172 SS1]|uniref:Uncharacterized protein n=1 Tax=Botryobasidium botryosum (strain FD-172 SS1) TaxID=930990 RepID=A0A067LY91_BOTB1|nr:hypothetical protein BOTBODRAFT_612397 [Botryobasidium botryosum FD-172 SS1]
MIHIICTTNVLAKQRERDVAGMISSALCVYKWDWGGGGGYSEYWQRQAIEAIRPPSL